MKATCPNNPEHKQFITSAHVMEEWVVDESGNFLQVLQATETTHGPDKGNVWACFMCGAQAKVE